MFQSIELLGRPFEFSIHPQTKRALALYELTDSDFIEQIAAQDLIEALISIYERRKFSITEIAYNFVLFAKYKEVHTAPVNIWVSWLAQRDIYYKYIEDINKFLLLM